MADLRAPPGGVAGPVPGRLKAPLSPDTPLSAFAVGFEPEADDLVVIKQRYSAFVGTELAGLLRERGTRTVVLVGLTPTSSASAVPPATLFTTSSVTLGDCTAEQTLARHEAGLASLAACFGRVWMSEDIAAAWQEQPALAEAHV